MTTAVIVQARMGSSRLPGKVMREISGRPMIEWVVERAGRIPGVDGVLVATSRQPRETPLVEHLHEIGVTVHRGPEGDVLGRYMDAVERFGLKTVVRITGDCPLLMPKVSNCVLKRYSGEGCDYASNTLERTYPRGLDTEVIGADTLATAAREATLPSDREHVTPYIRRHPDRFTLSNVAAESNRSDLRWTVDQEEDLVLLRRIFSLLDNPATAGYSTVLRLFEEKPELSDLNRDVQQRAP